MAIEERYGPSIWKGKPVTFQENSKKNKNKNNDILDNEEKEVDEYSEFKKEITYKNPNEWVVRND